MNIGYDITEENKGLAEKLRHAFGNRLVKEEYQRMKGLVRGLNKANGLPNKEYTSRYVGPLDPKNGTGFGIMVHSVEID